MREIDQYALELIQGDYATYKADYLRMKEALAHSEAIYKGKPVPFLYTPKFFSDQEVDAIRAIIDQATAIFQKVINRYLADGEYRQAFGFAPELEELILLPQVLKHSFPMARYDLFFRGTDDFHFCELNTDGSSAMNEDRETVRLFKDTLLYQKISGRYVLQDFDLVDRWVAEVREMYQELYQNELPQVAILDRFSGQRSPEFERFRLSFEQAGMRAVVVEPHELRFREDFLYYGDMRIDVVYRRLVTTDFMAYYAEHLHLVEAMKQGKTLWIGPIQTQIIHNKMLFAVLHLESFHPMFTEAEVAFIKKHIPYTEVLTADSLSRILKLDHDRYILKPMDLYGSRGVYAGRDVDAEAWEKLLLRYADQAYLIQEYVDLDSSAYMNFETDRVEPFRHISGVFVYRGQMAGFYSRAGQQHVISGVQSGHTLATFEAKLIENI